MKNFVKILSIFFLITVLLNAEGGKYNNLNKSNGEPSYTKFNINNVSTFIHNNGESDQNPNGNSGFVYPKGSNKAMFFKSGFVWGGKVNSEIRVGGSTYNSGMTPGKILEVGIAENQALPNVRIYRVRRDYKTAELDDEFTDIETAKEQYEKDWNEWPAEDGAPYEDINGNGLYNPELDIPGFPGADQTIWYVCNDLDETAVKNLYGSKPIGIEMQVTVWGYKNINLLRNTLFKKYVLINKSGKTINDMYVGMWSDPDLGDATDDLVGCDTTLDLSYVYNGDNYDWTYQEKWPVGGFKLIQGPKVDDKYLGMSSFVVIRKSSQNYDDPNFGEYVYGTLAVYNYFQGKISNGEHLFQSEINGEYSKFMVSGDPVNKTGWVDGVRYPPGDRRMMMSSGPFEMAPDDTQEVIFAQLAAGGDEIASGLNSITLLRNYSAAIGNLYFGFEDIASPNLEIKPFNKKILVTWGDSLSIPIENYSKGEYDFQGYTLYQLPNDHASRNEYVRIKTYDKIDGIGKIFELGFDPDNGEIQEYVSQYGSDTGIERFCEIDKDYITGKQLNNGTPYYFKLSAYAYNEKLKNIYSINESFSKTIKVIPQSTNPGIRYELVTGDKVETNHIRGNAEAEVDVMVIDPSEVKGHNYEINFSEDIEGNLQWDLDDITENITVLSNQKNITGTDEYIIVHGIRVIITEDENKPIMENDLYRFTTPKVNYNEELAKTDIEKINVFPNPYYGYNPMETQKLGNFVMINHLPEKAVIRVFNLAGQLVRTLHKDSPDQFYLWDLQNEHQFLVASGLYILHIEMPELGKVKVLKLAVILGTEVPDYY